MPQGESRRFRLPWRWVLPIPAQRRSEGDQRAPRGHRSLRYNLWSAHAPSTLSGNNVPLTLSHSPLSSARPRSSARPPRRGLPEEAAPGGPCCPHTPAFTRHRTALPGTHLCLPREHHLLPNTTHAVSQGHALVTSTFPPRRMFPVITCYITSRRRLLERVLGVQKRAFPGTHAFLANSWLRVRGAGCQLPRGAVTRTRK